MPWYVARRYFTAREVTQECQGKGERQKEGEETGGGVEEGGAHETSGTGGGKPSKAEREKAKQNNDG